MITKYKKLFIVFSKASIQIIMEYRLDFVMSAIFEFIDAAGGFVILYLLMNRFNELAGWNKYQVLLISLTFSLVTSVIGIVGSMGLKQFSRELSMGNIDKYLVRPINIQLITLISRWDWSQIFRFLGSIIVMAFIIPKSGLVSNPFSVVGFGVTIILAIVIVYSVSLILICLNFFIGRVNNVDFLIDTLSNTATVPTNIFKGIWLAIFSVVLPMWFIATFPVGILTGVYTYQFILGEFLIAVWLIFLSNFVLHLGLKKYSSSGG